jgi:Flp pilus assembly protein TadG
MMNSSRKSNSNRKGVVAVEFAVIAPVLLAIVMGVIEVNRILDSQNLLEVAAREGARFAAMDRTGLVDEGQSSNQKLIGDVKNFLASNGVPRDAIDVSVNHADNPESEFNIDDPNNDLALFEVRIEIDYSTVSLIPIDPDNDYALSAKVVFRNGRAVLSD